MSLAWRCLSFAKSLLGQESIVSIKQVLSLRFRTTQHLIYRILFGSNLRVLAHIYNTDKVGGHWYAQHYETHFAPVRRKKLNILEVGIGGYNRPELGGGSLRMWRTFFPKSKIYGIDLYNKSPHDERRIKTFMGSQIDPAFLEKVIKEIGRIDIIIDDGSHLNEHVLYTFRYLFPHLSSNGIYVIEDLQTSYWRKYGGTSEEVNRPDTSMGFLKLLVDGLNYAEFEKLYKPTYFDQHVIGIHFYHNIAFIQKGLNNEEGGNAEHGRITDFEVPRTGHGEVGDIR